MLHDVHDIIFFMVDDSDGQQLDRRAIEYMAEWLQQMAECSDAHREAVVRLVSTASEESEGKLERNAPEIVAVIQAIQ